MVTMKQIADRAGLSRTTVSFVLNNHKLAENLREETRQRVLDAAAELGYIPNEIAQSMTTGKSRMIAFVTAAPNQQYVARIMTGVMSAVDDRNYYLKLIPIAAAGLDKVYETILKRRVSGVIIQGVTGTEYELFSGKLTQGAIPHAVVGSSFELQQGFRVITDDIQGSYLAVNHLYELGHRRIMFLSTATKRGALQMREKGFSSAMADLGLKVDADSIQKISMRGPTDISPDRIRIFRNEITEILQQGRGRHTAIYCSLSKIALLVIQTARRLRLELPADLSVVGFFDSDVTKLSDPPITVVDQPHFSMGQHVAEKLIKAIEDKLNWSDHSEEERLPNELIVRASTGPAPA